MSTDVPLSAKRPKQNFHAMKENNFIVRPRKPIARRRPSPQLAQVLEQAQTRRTPSIQEQAREIHARTHSLRLATQQLLSKYK